MVRRILAATALAVVASGALGGVNSADAAYDQEGRRTGTAAADGSYAEIAGNGFPARSGQCVLYAALTTDFDGTQRQIESGLVRCNGANIDGTCFDGHAFVERYNGTNYYCQQGYTFTNNTAYDATTYRQSSTSTTFTGHVNGASLTQAGFGLADEVRGIAWGEATGGTGCPSPSRGTFRSWKRYDTSSGWSLVTGSTVWTDHAGITGAPCWVASPVSATGEFDVD